MGENPTDDARRVLRGRQSGPPRPMRARCLAWGMTHKDGGRGGTSAGRVVVEDETGKEETSGETTCTVYPADGVGGAVDLVDAEATCW